ncbi:MAG: hypothetical protein OHK93_008330 [Ramalina farinacea]|uniref:Uncharacterized protein n=1 Tax=Ramalina farinacea TaxID=258253 RepID=A0AA43QNE1_9LECA|nr:hypothetical protein [Ramalina farinacea]
MLTPLYLTIPSTLFALIFIFFGLNALFRPESALAFISESLHYPTATFPTSSSDQQKLINALLVIYGARDIFMGLAIGIVTFLGSSKTLGWVLLSASGVAVADGWAVSELGDGSEWNHWGYAPLVAAVGVGALVVGDGKAVGMGRGEDAKVRRE